MVLTGEETNLFFESNVKMAIPNVTKVQIVNEGISEVTDLLDFGKDTLQHITDNLIRPVGRVPETKYIAPVPLMLPLTTVTKIKTHPFLFGAKYQKRLLIACDMV